MKIIGFHTRHDSNVAVTKDGKVLLALELERLFRVRYFASSGDRAQFENEWSKVRSLVRDTLGIEQYDCGVTCWLRRGQGDILRELFPARRWKAVGHHLAHAATGYYESPFEDAIIVSYDGGGNDGTFNVFSATPASLERIATMPFNLGRAYRLLGTVMPEVTGGVPQRKGGSLALAGKLMAYAALGELNATWKPALRDYFLEFRGSGQSLRVLLRQLGLSRFAHGLPATTARDLAATLQNTFEEVVLEIIAPMLAERCPKALILTGGCALNVSANEAIAERHQIPIFVPPNPGDGGIGLGATWLIERPTERSGAYLGAKLASLETLPSLVAAYSAKRTTPREIARLLVEGYILGVARGSAEFGPRALGNRSILCYPSRVELKAQLNAKVKFREWYRPFAPAVPLESVGRFARRAVDSPFMSFAPLLTDEAKEQFPAIAHLDGTARVQTVTRNDNAWFYDLITAVGSITGNPVLLNTSLNTKGNPIVNDVHEPLRMLDDGLLDAVVIEDWLFHRHRSDA